MDFPDFSSVKARAAQLMSGAKLAAQQGFQQLQQTPSNVSAIQNGLGGMGIQAPDAWDISSSLHSAKDRLLGLWRGYVAPAIRRTLP